MNKEDTKQTFLNNTLKLVFPNIYVNSFLVLYSKVSEYLCLKPTK